MGGMPSGCSVVLACPSGSISTVLAQTAGIARRGQGIMSRRTAAAEMATCVYYW